MNFFVCLFFTRRIWLSTHLLSIDSTLFFVCSPIWYKSVLSCFKSEAFVDWIHNGTRCWWNNEQRFCFVRRDILSLYTLNYTVKHLQQFTRSILIFFFFFFLSVGRVVPVNNKIKNSSTRDCTTNKCILIFTFFT